MSECVFVSWQIMGRPTMTFKGRDRARSLGTVGLVGGWRRIVNRWIRVLQEGAMASERLGAALLLCLTILATGCAREPATPMVSPATSLPAATRTPTDAPTPTLTPRPTATWTPLPTHAPTDTPPPRPAPTETREPTETSTPTPFASPTQAVDLTSIASITADRAGEAVTVAGTIVDAISFSHGFKFTLDDGQGQIVLLMWHDVYDDCWDRAELNVGARVRVSGEVNQYEGELQIEPRFGGDVKLMEPAIVQAPRREIASISSDDAGKRMMIEGEVVRTEGLPTAVKVFLRAGETADPGEIPVFVWRNVLDRIADNVGLGTPGSRLRVVGTVQVYRSNVEIVPALPNDVTVLEIP